jgi:SAM-dependent methyltransferase
MSKLVWKDDQRFVLGGTTFVTMPSEFLTEGVHLREGEFFIFKPPAAVERYVALIDELKPRHILELGIHQGGSTLFFAELARPRKLAAIDRLPLPEVRKRLERHAAGSGLAGVVQTFVEVDQADRPRLAEVIEEAFGGNALDLVVDDCSHLYHETRASFNELFPRLRPGGVYVIEDWRWAHTELGKEPLQGFFPDQVPLTRLLFEIVLAIPGVPGLISEVSIHIGAAVIRRGDASTDPATFDVAACSNPRGQALLAPA